MEYTVRWEISIDADSPEGAALSARLMMLDAESTATIFTTENVTTGEVLEVDVEDLISPSDGLETIVKIGNTYRDPTDIDFPVLGQIKPFYVIRHLLEENQKNTEFYTDAGFVNFVSRIAVENEDNDMSITCVSEAKEYIMNYCPNLHLF